VTDSEENLRFVGLNQPITQAEQTLKEQLGMKLSDIREQFQQELQQLYQQQPAMQQIVNTENDVVEIDVDIIIEEVPDVVNLQSEQFELLVQMYQANPEGIRWEDVIAMSTLRNKNRILGKELTPEEQQAQAQQQEQQQEALEIQKADAIATIKGKEAKATKDAADAQAQLIENSVVESGLGTLLDLEEQTINIEKKRADTQQSQQKAFQTAVETELLVTNPPPQKVAVI